MTLRLRMAPRRLMVSESRRLQPTSKIKTVDPFYVSPQWRALVNHIRRERGWRCEDPKCATPYGPWKQIYCDHVVELSDGGAPLEVCNVLQRCGLCHGRKTAEAKVARAAEGPRDA
jgi:5-methylcytosine-specific restriction protein A